MARREPDPREELVAALARISRQIELLENPATPMGAGRELIDNAALIAELAGVRHEIELRLSEFGPDPIAG